MVLAPPTEAKEARAAALSARRRPHPAHRCTRTARPRGSRALGEPGDAGWFGPGSTIWSVHADAATLVGGVRALLVQAMHPTVLAGFDQHSDYQEDPESRLQRTAAFVTVTTFGTTAQAEAACDRVRRAHAPVRGRTPDGEPYDAGDPELLGWVHLALADSLAVAVQRFGRTRFDLGRLPGRHGRGRRAARVGPRAARPRPGWPPPGTTTCRSSRSPSATTAAHAFLLDPPLPLRIRLPYRVIAAAAAAIPAAGAAPPARRPTACCPTCPRGWSAGPRPGCSRRSSARARPPAPPTSAPGRSVPSGDELGAVRARCSARRWRRRCSPAAPAAATRRPTGPADTATPSSQAPTSAPPVPGVPAELTDPYACRGGFICAGLEVPLDRADPSGATLTLQVALEADPDASRGVLLALNGGPGAAGAPLAPELVERFGPEVVADYRIVALDQRGTGPSALECPALQQDGATRFVPSADAVRACAATSGDARGHYGTDDTVADLDRLREVLGADRLSLFAVSYGTFVAQQYAVAHPGETELLVLDSALPAGGVDTLQRDVVRATPRVLGLACRAAGCPGDPVADLAAVVAGGRRRRPAVAARRHELGPAELRHLAARAAQRRPWRPDRAGPAAAGVPHRLRHDSRGVQRGPQRGGLLRRPALPVGPLGRAARGAAGRRTPGGGQRRERCTRSTALPSARPWRSASPGRRSHRRRSSWASRSCPASGCCSCPATATCRRPSSRCAARPTARPTAGWSSSAEPATSSPPGPAAVARSCATSCCADLRSAATALAHVAPASANTVDQSDFMLTTVQSWSRARSSDSSAPAT